MLGSRNMPSLENTPSFAGVRVNVYVGLFLLVLGTSAAQLLLKAAAQTFVAGAGLAQPRFLTALAIAGFASLATQLAWMWMLRWVPLGSGYAVFALNFLIVPAASALFFREVFDVRHVIGGGLIVAGVIVALGARV